tara:strand:- start:6246 stop:7190 length:945 start_codon:yes stop_codon:yes gene_type:complete
LKPKTKLIIDEDLTKMKTPIIIKLDIDDFFLGTEAIALVSQPAIETDFFTFKAVEDRELTSFFSALEELPASEAAAVRAFFMSCECECEGACTCNTADKPLDTIVRDDIKTMQYRQGFSVVDEDKRMIVSPVMIPNLPIPRIDEMGEKFYVYFTDDTIERMAHKFVKDKLTDSFNIEHDGSTKLNGIHLVESWIKVTANDKSSKFGFSELPIGTWFTQLSVEDDNLWKMIKDKVVKGISLEGAFNQIPINKKEDKFVNVATLGGTRLFIKEDTLVTFIVDDSNEIVSIAPDGEYNLTDGTQLIVKGGKASVFPG